MADPNSAPVATGNESGQLDYTGLSNDLSSIDKQYDPQITSERESAQHYEQQAVQYSEQEATETESMARDEPAQDQKLQNYLKSTPTRQASYATVMHTAPVLAILTALGGKITKLSGQNMLAATSGIVSGMNAASEKQYEDAYNAWMQGYQKLKEHQTALMHQHQLMLQAYKGRADAYQKASEAARRQTGDLLDEKQQAAAGRINTFKAQSQAVAQLDRTKYAMEQLHERNRHDLQMESHWKDLEKKAQGKDPAITQALKTEHENWGNAKAQVDEYMKQRGQVNSNLNLSEDVKAQMLGRIDESVSALEMSMNQSIARSNAIAARLDQSPTAPVAGPGGGGAPRGAQPSPAPHPPTPNQASELPDAAKQQLAAHKGKAVTFGNNQTWIMDQTGNVSRVQ
jgi:hypothetical protein